MGTKTSGQDSRGFRVLVVDDNEDAADSLAFLIRVWGFDARVAYDGAVGLATAREFHPDCMVVDIAMPGIDGYALARQIRENEQLQRTRLIALSAFSGDEHSHRAEQAGFNYLMTKPADLRELQRLLAMMQNILNLASRAEELARHNVTLAGEATELLREVKQDIREVKEEVRELKEELRELKEDRQQENGDSTATT